MREIRMRVDRRMLVENRRRWVWTGLSLLTTLMLGVGIYFEQYFFIFAFIAWLCAETLLMRLQPWLRIYKFSRKQFTRKNKTESEVEVFWHWYHEASENAFTLAGLRLSEWLGSSPEQDQKQWAKKYRTLFELKLLIDSKTALRGNRGLQQNILFQSRVNTAADPFQKALLQNLSKEQILEAALSVSDLLLQVQSLAEKEDSIVGIEARSLIEKILGVSFEITKSRSFIDRLSDSIQKESGIPFLMLNLIRRGEITLAREFGRKLLAEEIECDEELKSTLYWLAEIHWFSTEKKQEILTHDEAIKSLYHLCFVSPDRAGFLEIDSQFFSEFGPINEIAEEGFLFKEALIEAVLVLWENYEGWTDGVFQFVLEALTGRKSKIYDERPNWVRFWKHEKLQFSREYLYVVEGNLSFCAGRIEEAKFCYQKALEINSRLRAGVFNLAYVAAKTKDEATHQWAIKEICKNQDWLPLGLAAIGNSYFILGKDHLALEYYDKLRCEKGWEKKVDFYISLFYLEIGVYEQALVYAKKAHDLNPLDSSMSFHLSRCYSKVGAKEAALEVFNRANFGSTKASGDAINSAWMTYYRFTLERDSGKDEQAIKTLMQIPREFFQDSDELVEALEFARRKQDLGLLRHLKTVG